MEENPAALLVSLRGPIPHGERAAPSSSTKRLHVVEITA